MWMQDRGMRSVLLAIGLSAAAAGVAAAAQTSAGGELARKIREAKSSAPAALAADATILDWPDAPGEAFGVLREGSNGWYCLPDYPADRSFAPECFDEEWLAFLTAYVAGEAPETKRIGLSYMLNARWAASNTDRSATGPTADNQWHEGGAHLMLVVPDPALLEWFPTTPTPAGSAYVMFAGTPWAHLMIPIPQADESDGS